MKLPRWLIVTLLTTSVLAVLGAGAWWWVTWPERTAREFVERVFAEELTRSLNNEPIPLERTLRPQARDEIEQGEPWILQQAWRSLGDILIGRQEFKVERRIPGLYSFAVQRGLIVEHSVEFR